MREGCRSFPSVGLNREGRISGEGRSKVRLEYVIVIVIIVMAKNMLVIMPSAKAIYPKRAAILCW
jgi:hypothetical protein